MTMQKMWTAMSDLGILLNEIDTNTIVEYKNHETEMDKDIVEVWGFKDLETRKKSLARKAKHAKEQAEKFQKEADRLAEAPDLLDKYYHEAKAETQRLLKQGKVRIEGNLGGALWQRDLASTVGLIKANTKVVCTVGRVALEEVYWGDPWIAELVNDIKKAGIDANGRQKFYNNIAKMKDDPDAIQAEAGLIALGQYND